MDLLGDWVYPAAITLIVVALAGGAALTWRTPRGWRGLLLNGLVVALASTLVLVSVGLMLNHDNAWYPTLDDLIGSSSSTSREAGAKSGTDTFGKEPLSRIDTRSLPALPAPGERIQTFSVPTSVGTASWAVTVVLPADYFDPASAQRAYPVLVAGHGQPGTMANWTGVIDIRRYADPLVAAHTLAPMITVIPALSPGGEDTECVFGPGGADQVETWLAKDVPAFVKAHLRAIPQRTAWAWIGLSAGGWCGAMITLRHPDAYAAALLLAGYFEPWWNAKPPWKIPSAQESSYDLVALEARKPPPVALWVETSKKDPESWPTTEKFLAAARTPTLVKAVVDSSGGHSWSAWLPHVPESLTWLARTVPGFAPS